MTDLTLAIDPDAAHRRWMHQLEYHLGLIPKLLGAALALATPDTGVSRAGSQFDRPQVTGGGFYSALPTDRVDHRSAGDATYLWSLLAEYAESVSEWLAAPTRIPAKCPGSSTAAHDAALLLVGVLIDHAGEVWEHRQLDGFEQELFAEVRRQQRRLLPAHDGVPQHARDCTTCGEPRAVRVVWVDAVNGSPRPVQVGKCRTCGQEYRHDEGTAA